MWEVPAGFSLSESHMVTWTEGRRSGWFPTIKFALISPNTFSPCDMTSFTACDKASQTPFSPTKRLGNH